MLIAVRDLATGPAPASAGRAVVVAEAVRWATRWPSATIAAGGEIVRVPACRSGRRPRRSATGAWVHTHNLASDYLATFAHRGGER